MILAVIISINAIATIYAIWSIGNLASAIQAIIGLSGYYIRSGQ